MNVNTGKRFSDSEGGDIPIYLKIQRHFLDQIADGVLRSGDRLPTEMEIAKDFGTSRATVQNAMSRLVYEGWIEKQVGRGTFVADVGRSAQIDLDDVRSFEEDVVSHGDRVRYRLLQVGRETLGEDLADRLRAEVGDVVFAFERLRCVGDDVIGMETRYFAPGLALDFPIDALDSLSTHALVETYMNQQIGRMEASIRAVLADDEKSQKLGVPPGSALLLRRHTMFSATDSVILFGEAYYCEPFAFRYTARTRQDL